MEIIDISPELSERTAVWPGDVAMSRVWQCQLEQGSNLDLSSVTTTVHIGAHADAPSHYKQGAPTIEAVDLDPYIGECWVIAVEGAPLIRPEHCQAAIAKGARRILFKTLSQPDPERFNTNFTAFSAEAIAAMGEAGVCLVGIDTASVDPFDSKDLPAHHMLMRYDMRNLEGLSLRHVPEGRYELIALPLKLRGFDASPVRAILRK